MESSGFFNAEILDNGSYDRVYMADQFAGYFSKFIGNGVFVTPASQLKVVPKVGEMAIAVSAGDAYINGYWYKNDSFLYKNLNNASGTYARIDRVVVRLDYTQRNAYIAILEGTPAASPAPVDLTRNSDVYEIALADVVVEAAAIEIKDENIADRRNNADLCGYVKGVVDQIDATNLFSQFTDEFNSWFDNIKGQLSGDVAANLQNQLSSQQKIIGDKDISSISDGTLTQAVLDIDGNLDDIQSKYVQNIYVGEDGLLHKLQGGADSVIPFSGEEEYRKKLYNALLYSFAVDDNMSFDDLLNVVISEVGDKISVLDSSGLKYNYKILQAGNSSAVYQSNQIKVKPYYASGARNGAGCMTTVVIPNSSKCKKIHYKASVAPNDGWMEAVISLKNTAYVNSALGGEIAGDTVKVLGSFGAGEKSFDIPEDYIGSDLYVGVYSMSYGNTTTYGIVTDIWLTID